MTQNWQRRIVAALAFLGLAAFTHTASAQTCTPAATNNGPDVIVGDLNGIANYTSAGGIEALAIGTTSCNIGNANLSWISNTNQHPVIGQTLYRYSVVGGAGRFEQVGQGWLKHGFFALSEGLCCSQCQGTSGSALGVRCSDPYTAARNGSQSGLGPKWQVNAYTGAFTYPPANPAWSGSVARRVQVAITDLEVTAGSTTRYFGTGHYVTPDDAAAGNQNNNESWREVTVTGSGTAWTFGFTGTTRRTEYALKAWKFVDPTVTLKEIQIPGDGLVVVGYKTTNLNNGFHRYEYAVQNLNADRSIGSFSIPLPVGATIQNIGFRDVAYHSGDGEGNITRDGTDWAGVVSGGAITWTTAQTFAQNPNGNALRWGTTYNFRFDADAPPVVGSATLGHFKIAGTSATSVDVPGTPGPASYAFCFGDGSGLACPCGNNSTVGFNEGCLNSLGTGASLTAAGTASVAADTFALTGNGMPDSSALYFQGTSQQSGGAGAAFGDGLRCAAGSVIRLGTKVNILGTSQYPTGGDQAVSVRGATSPGDVRTYQIWYRNAAAFCTASTFNLSNGWQQVWAP
ncbi:MAG: hypothetical protein JNK02_10705 [Planctomycetes bacterium]|nr:hypothetical protein [Planctomycetota bacterium]